MADFGEILSNYAQRRFDQATQPLTDPGGYLENRINDRFGGPDTEANVTPKSTTISYNPDNTVDITHKTTMAAPDVTAVPEARNILAQNQAQPAPQAQPVAAPVQPQATMTPAVASAPQTQPQTRPMWSDIQGQEINNGAPNLNRIQPNQPPAQPAAPQPAPGPVQTAAPAPITTAPQAAPIAAAPAPAVAPAAPAPNVVPPTQVAQAPAPAAVAQPAPAPATWQDQVSTAKTADDWKNIMINPDTPDDIRRISADRYAQSQKQIKEEQQAEKTLTAAATGDPKAQTELARAIRKSTDEGSYIKAILFARLGLNDLAKEEQQKLGAGTMFQSVVGNAGERYTAEVNGQGAIVRAFDTTGKSVDENKVAELSANAIAAKAMGHASATRIRDQQGKEWSVVPTTRGSIFYDNMGRQGVPVGQTVPVAVGSDVNLKYNMGFYGAQGTAQGRAAGEGFTPGATVTAPGMPGGAVAPQGQGGQAPGVVATLPNGARVTAEQQTYAERGFPIISGVRTKEENDALKYRQLPNGTWVTKEGNPVSDSTVHAVGSAMDIDSKKLTTAQRRELSQNGWYQPIPQQDPNHWEKLPGATAPQAAPGQGPAPSTNPNIPSAGFGPSNIPGGAPQGTVAQQRQQLEIGGKRTEAFNKIIDTEYRETAAKGEIVSTNRKKQFEILNRVDPDTNKGVAEQISGLATAANEKPWDQKFTIVRDLIAGKVATDSNGSPMNGQQLSERLQGLNLSPAAKGALLEFNALNAQIAAQTLKETAGPGSVSDAEQAANRARNVDITKSPMLGAYNMMGQSQFNGDLQRYKADLAASENNRAPNATAFDRDFRRTSAALTDSYKKVTEARLDFINKNGGANNPNAIREGYKRFPTPEYDPQSGNWKYLKPLNEIFGK